MLIVSQGKSLAEIVLEPRAGSVLRAAAESLQEIVHRRTGVALPIREGGERRGEGVKIHLGTCDGSEALNEALGELGRQPVSADRPGREGFLLLSEKRGEAACVVINGCDDLGAFHGAGWFLRRLDFSDGQAVAPDHLEISTAPATEMRRIRFGDHFGYANTELSGWREIWTDYILWGLSAATFRCDPAHQGDPRETKLAKVLLDRWAERVPLARSLGLEVVHLTQTNLASKDGEFGPNRIPDFQELNSMCPDFNGVNPKFPRGRQVLRDSRKWFFDYMPRVEEVNYYLTSGWDGGGCKDPEVSPWSVTYAGLVDEIVYPLIAERNPGAKIILGLYGVTELEALAARLQEGWDPAWLDALEFNCPEAPKAPLFPERLKRYYFPMWTTDYNLIGSYQTCGANPCPRLCEEKFREIWDRDGIRGGLGCYSEGTHDFVNQVVMMQLAWDPGRSADEIIDELCRYYFGGEAAPTVKEIILRMGKERIGGALFVDDPQLDRARYVNDPQFDPRIQELIPEAEERMPPWARSSRQWALLVGRAGMSRTRRRQADLMAEWDVRFNRYRSFLEGTVSQEGDGPEETRAYFRSVVKNACDTVAVMNETERRGCAVQGGMQLVRWPDERTGDALEAVEALEGWDGKGPALRIPGRWCTAAVGVGGDVYVIDGWRNLSSSGDMAADARLVMADIFGSGSNQVVFLGSDNLLRAWSPADGARLLARGEFLTGPLVSGDVDGDGREEIVVLAGPSPDKGSLTVVNGDGDVRAMAIRPGGSQPDEPVRGAYREETWIPRAVRMDCEPRLVICDVDGDGQQEIICSDRDDGDRLVVLDGHGNRKMMGPVMQAGALAAADLNGDGNPEVVFLNGNGLLRAFSAKSGVLAFEESVKPRWPSVATPQWEKEELPGVVFVDAEGYLRIVSLRGASRRVSDLPSSVAMAPGLTVGDFDGDGREEICYLRRHLSFVYPLVRLSCMNESGGMHDLSKSPWGSPEEAPFGPRASGRMRLGSEV